MSYESIKWRGYFKVTSPSKIPIMIKKLEKLMSEDITVISNEKYWKDTSLYEVNFTTPLAIDNIEKTIFKVLRLSSFIGYNCTVIGPNSFDNETWSFQGIISKTTVPGLEWIHFELEN